MKFTRDSQLMLFGIGSHESTWKGVRYLLFIYLGSLLFAAVATGPVYTFIKGPVFACFHWFGELTQWEIWAYLTKDRSFDKSFDRLSMLFILLTLPWLFVACGLCSLSSLSLKFNRAHRIHFVIWFGVGVVILALVIATQLVFTDVAMRETSTVSRWLTICFAVLFSGLAVALIEEGVFRGLMLRIFYSAMRPVAAIILSSLFFAYVHFRMPDIALSMMERTDAWWLGFYVAFWMLFGITVNFSWLVFLNLFVFGVLLCLVFLRTRSLLACMGLHAGVVWLRLAYIKLFEIHDHPAQSFGGGGKVIDGLFPLFVLSAMCLYLAFARDKGDMRLRWAD